jgi:hypothetical protein
VCDLPPHPPNFQTTEKEADRLQISEHSKTWSISLETVRTSSEESYNFKIKESVIKQLKQTHKNCLRSLCHFNWWWPTNIVTTLREHHHNWTQWMKHTQTLLLVREMMLCLLNNFEKVTMLHSKGLHTHTHTHTSWKRWLNSIIVSINKQMYVRTYIHMHYSRHGSCF